MKIDVFNHVFPEEFFVAAEKLMPATAVQRWKAMDELYDMNARMRVISLLTANRCFHRDLSSRPKGESAWCFKTMPSGRT